MEGSLAEELYSEALRLSHVELHNASASHNGQDLNVLLEEISDFKQRLLPKDCNEGDLWHEDDALWDNSSEELNKASDLDREWQRRHNQFHTIGYRDGLIAGKEASAQEGFNIGFRESVLVGYKWGIVRGVTSAFACLPDGLKEKLVETQEKRNKFQSLHESVHSLSTTDALQLFHDDHLREWTARKSENVELSSNIAGLQDQTSGSSRLENYFVELQSLLCESPAIEVPLAIDQ